LRMRCNSDGVLTLEKESDMFANVLMLALFYVVLVIPVLWVLQPARLVTPY